MLIGYCMLIDESKEGMAMEKRLLIVSNRLPYQAEEKGEEIVFRQSSGGLVSAIKSYFEKYGNGKFEKKIWIGTPDFSAGNWEILKHQQTDNEFELHPVFLDEKTYDDYYNGFSNSVLWPLFHYFSSFANFQQEQFEAYKKVNESFAAQIAETATDTDVIWIHDYHLFLLPAMLRKLRPNLTIGFFLHIPFPNYEIFRQIPRQWRKDILEGLLGSDMTGFHTIEYRRYFLEAVQMALNTDNDLGNIYYGTRVVKTDIFPIGIDNQKFSNAVKDDKTIKVKTEIRQSFANQKIIFSLDRLDYTKGVLQRLKGYERFLTENPEWHEKVVMILNVIPSRDQHAKYSERKLLIEQSLSAINGKFATYNWQPIVYFYQHLDFENLSALYQLADVALVTPLRDGMNLVAKEYVASQSAQEGVLILSELAGAANELSEALIVNPFDETEVAYAIHRSLILPIQERKQKMALMQKRLIEYDVQRWVDDFLNELEKAKELQESRSTVLLDNKNCRRIISKAKEADKRLYFFDYDGTLTPYSKHPALAEPGEEILKILSRLSSDKKNKVVIISGRDSTTLDKWIGALPLTIVAEHGATIKYQHGEWQSLLEYGSDWKKDILPVMELFAKRCNGSFTEEKQYSIAWHYRNAEKQLGFSRSRELIQNLSHILANTSLRVIDGNKVVEVRSANINKGVVARKIMQELNPSFTLCIGDDKTDEDMFEALQGDAVTIKIGMGGTAALYTIPQQQQVLPFLNTLNALECK